jgi:hypothetical protein
LGSSRRGISPSKVSHRVALDTTVFALEAAAATRVTLLLKLSGRLALRSRHGRS